MIGDIFNLIYLFIDKLITPHCWFMRKISKKKSKKKELNNLYWKKIIIYNNVYKLLSH